MTILDTSYYRRRKAELKAMRADRDNRFAAYMVDFGFDDLVSTLRAAQYQEYQQVRKWAKVAQDDYHRHFYDGDENANIRRFILANDLAFRADKLAEAFYTLPRYRIVECEECGSAGAREEFCKSLSWDQPIYRDVTCEKCHGAGELEVEIEAIDPDEAAEAEQELSDYCENLCREQIEQYRDGWW